MKSKTLTCITTMTFFAALAAPMRVAAQKHQQQTAQNLPHYAVTDLGTLGGSFAQAFGINDKGEVVGWSIDGTGNQRAVIWQDKVPLDLNTLIPAGSGWYLQAAQSINDAGEIAGFGSINGNVHAFLAVPCNSDQADSDGCEDDR